MMKTLTIFLALLFVAGMVLAEDGKKAQPAADSTQQKVKSDEKAGAAEDSTKKTEETEYITTESGLRYADLVVGTGKEAAVGDSVECHYTLWVADKNDKPGKKIQSSKDMNRTFEFKVGGPLIKGWNEGMLGMKEGGTRMLIIPPHLGYGNRPPQEGNNLIFKIEFIRYKK